jgi:acetoacetyl-CoA reductase
MAAKQRIAVVTGGMGGLGETISTKMADAGYRVVVTYSPSNTKFKSWLQDMKSRNYDFSAFAVDVADYDQCARQCQLILSECGPIDILVNNAGITRDMTFKKMSKADWDAVMRTNLDSCFNMTKQVMDGMVDRGWGRVINVSSVNGQKGAFGQTNYSAAKAGIHGFTKALALEVARKGVTVNTIPGLHRHEDGHRHPEGDPRLQDPAADPGVPAGQARRGGRPDHLPLLGRGRVRHRRQHLHQRRPAHVLGVAVRE